MIIVGGVIKNDNKYLLVQEAKEKCRGKWNLPAGRLEPNETIVDGAKREINEECGLIVNLTGVATIEDRVINDKEVTAIVFSTEIIDGSISYNKDEILDVRWFSYEKILNMHDKLRSYDWITRAVISVENNTIKDINVIEKIK